MGCASSHSVVVDEHCVPVGPVKTYVQAFDSDRGFAPPGTVDAALKPPTRKKKLVGGHFQVQLENGKWESFPREEDVLITRACLAGRSLCHIIRSGRHYEIDFRKMVQRNLETGKEKQLRTAPVERPLQHTGTELFVTVQEGQPGSVIEVDDPTYPGLKVKALVPNLARAGTKVAVPVPVQGQAVDEIVKKDGLMMNDFDKNIAFSGATTGKVVVGTSVTAVRGVVVDDCLHLGA